LPTTFGTLQLAAGVSGGLAIVNERATSAAAL